MNSFLGCAHPTIFKFLDSLKKEQIIQDVNIDQLEVGMELTRRNKKNLSVKERMLKVVQSYREYDTIKYLENVASNVYI